MGNIIHSSHTSSSSASSRSSPHPPEWTAISRQNSASKEVHITTNHPSGFHFTGEQLTGTVKIPRSLLHRHMSSIKNRTPAELLHKRSLRSAIMVELIGDATYSAELDVAADSDGHVEHRVNLCRERCLVTMNAHRLPADTLVHSSSSPDSIASAPHPSPIVQGTFQITIPDDLPPSLANKRSPAVVYTLELSISSSRSRYQVPITVTSRGYVPHPMTNIELADSAVNRNDVRLAASIARSCYRPGEQIAVRITCANPQQRLVRAITVRLVQVYRIHNDHHRLQIDGKEWTFEAAAVSPQHEWTGEATLHLADQHLPASYLSHRVGTTRTIECELSYLIDIELTEKKGDEIHLTLSPIQVTYQM